jgi:hypothetical protein
MDFDRDSRAKGEGGPIEDPNERLAREQREWHERNIKQKSATELQSALDQKDRLEREKQRQTLHGQHDPFGSHLTTTTIPTLPKQVLDQTRADQASVARQLAVAAETIQISRRDEPIDVKNHVRNALTGTGVGGHDLRKIEELADESAKRPRAHHGRGLRREGGHQSSESPENP